MMNGRSLLYHGGGGAGGEEGGVEKGYNYY